MKPSDEPKSNQPSSVKPGQSVAPGGQDQSQSMSAMPPVQPAAQSQSSPLEPSAQTTQQSPQQQPPSPANPVQPTPGPVAASQSPALATNQPQNEQLQPLPPEEIFLSWNAAEFIYNHKPFGWYLLLALIFLALIGAAIWTHQWLLIAVFALMGIALGVYANRKPRTLTYSVTNRGVDVGDKKYGYDQFKTYFESDDYGQLVFDLVPTKRFAPLVSLPITKEIEAKIEDHLASYLPKTEPRNDSIEKVFKLLHF